jgi:hypothetical protein
MGKFILTEQEKLRIKSLYEQTTGDKLIAKKNPYKYDEYRNIPHIKDFKDNSTQNFDTYYDYNNSLLVDTLRTTLTKFYEPLLLNKTLRSDKGEILKITGVLADPFVIPFKDFDRDQTYFQLELTYNNDQGLYSRIEMPAVKPQRSTKFDVPDNYKAGDHIPQTTTNLYTVEPSDQLLEFLKKNPFNWVETRKKLPDNIFSIYKKGKTDFEP